MDTSYYYTQAMKSHSVQDYSSQTLCGENKSYCALDQDQGK